MRIFRNKKLIVGLIALAALLLARFSGVLPELSIATIKAYREYLTHLVETQYTRTVFAYIAIYITSVSLFLPAAMILTVTGGFLFGAPLGTLYANIGATIGSAISFLLVRYAIGGPLQKRYKKQLANFNAAMERDGTLYLLAIHLVAVIPFFIMNILAGLTNVSLWTFIWTTSIGIIPGSFVYAFAGQQLHLIESVRDIFSPMVLLAFSLLGLLAVMPVIIRKIRSG